MPPSPAFERERLSGPRRTHDEHQVVVVGEEGIGFGIQFGVSAEDYGAFGDLGTP
jgi:hypothetical protein